TSHRHTLYLHDALPISLEAAGVQTIVGIHEQRARSLNEFYIKHRLTGTPFVSAKFALSIDGKIATRSGESRWITGEKSRLHAHRSEEHTSELQSLAYLV